MKRITKLLVYATVVGFTMLIGLIASSVSVARTGEDVALHATIMILGAAIGWLSGTAMTPYSAGERGHFTTFAKAASAFASGYLISKADHAVEMLFSPDFLERPLASFRIMGCDLETM